MTAILATTVLAVSTAYSPCSSGSIMADGTHTRAGSVAHNGYPLGKRLTIWPSPDGRRRFTVRDRIGHGTEVDFWVADCQQAIQWGRRTVHIREGWFRLRAKVKVTSRRYEFEMGTR
jgi:3D (Asp-Asp-Asp) domain-containing protein